ncbi:NAD(P)H-binding protein [Bradyrhizobium sp. 155]|uniref:NAD(P)H-binding protein n=1 Tax=unclassified Bradyrhizobium TaxID=2631580 RepID=UPI000475D28C|nr:MULTISPECIES: NAD(P)H-binding protein [unclassified Bradyrhizobium]MCK1700669.1 NAD(P)H-binding protein [Bradyrhizobium sp. 146]UPK11156.1 NAD(P)H-binding protein [Bradyrhizobium sp. 155]
MSKRPPILITGAGGEVGSIGRTMIKMLLSQQYPVRAFVRREDERAEALRQAGVEVFVGDLLDVADVAAALKGCRRIYFSMSLNPYYSDATILMAAAARAQGGIEVFVNISEFEQTFMTFDRMTAEREARIAWLGGSVAEWSPQQRAHWASEQALQWSGLPVVNIRATMFAENPILSWFPLKQLLSAGELHLPFGTQKIAPMAAYDVAEVCAKILIDPPSHVSMSYALTGPVLKDMHGFAEDYGAALERKISYVPQDPDAWIDTYINRALASRNPHIADHLKAITRLVAGGRYDVVTDELERLLGRAPKTVQWALEHNPRIRKALEGA